MGSDSFAIISIKRINGTGHNASLPILLDGFKIIRRGRDGVRITKDDFVQKGSSSLKGSDSFPARCFVPEMLVNFVLKKLHHNESYELQPSSYFFHGVCLLVDISGFTKLSGEFCSQGKGGIDELQLATNGFMGQLVEVIYEFGGDIVKFAGDAIICVFSSELKVAVSRRVPSKEAAALLMPTHSNEHVAQYNAAEEFTTPIEVVLRAMHCAQMLRGIQTDKLSVHVAMSCGEMCFGILGGWENRWECLISGSCIHELSDCLDDAPSKQAVISRSCAQVLQAGMSQSILNNNHGGDLCMIESYAYETDAGKYQFLVEALRSGNQRIIGVSYSSNSRLFDTLAPTPALITSLLAGHDCTDAAADHSNLYSSSNYSHHSNGALTNAALSRDEKRALQALIRPFVPVPILEGQDSSDMKRGLAEIRETTTMFMKCDSYDVRGQHRDLLQLQACYLCAQMILNHAGAFIRQFLVDDKGCVLIACWGVPHLSYLDNALRSLTAAAQIRHDLTQLGMNCSFGITTGDVYCGTVGSPLRMEYAAIGSVVNMAARLMCKAHGGILIDDATYARLPGTIAALLTTLDPILVKGRKAPLPVFSYVALTPISRVKETSEIEDEEVKEEYKEILLDFLECLLKPRAKNSVSAHSTHSEDYGLRRSSFVDHLLAHVSGACPPYNSNNSSCSNSNLTSSGRKGTQLALIEGHEGLGRSSIATWLRKQATRLQLPVFTVKCSRKDALLSYVVWAKLFAQLMPREIFQGDPGLQRRHVRALLLEVYPEEAQLAETIAFPVMQLALGITCSYAYEQRAHHGGGGHATSSAAPSAQHRCGVSPLSTSVLRTSTVASPLSSTCAAAKRSTFISSLRLRSPATQSAFSRMAAPGRLPAAAAVVTTTSSVISTFRTKPVPSGDATSTAIPLTPALVKETLKRLFAHLLSWRTVLIVLENVHYADAESLQTLLELAQLPTRSAIVLTAEMEQGSGPTGVTTNTSSKPYRYTGNSTSISYRALQDRRAATAVKSLPWATSVQKMVTERAHTTRITLQDYTRVDMDRMLASALGVPAHLVPATFSQLVLDFSGGSYYWMKEILQFIREHGPDEFLSTIDDDSVVTGGGLGVQIVSSRGTPSTPDLLVKNVAALSVNPRRLTLLPSFSVVSVKGAGSGGGGSGGALSLQFGSAQPSPAPTTRQGILRLISSSRPIVTMVSHLSSLTLSTAPATPLQPTPAPSAAMRRALSRKAIGRSSIIRVSGRIPRQAGSSGLDHSGRAAREGDAAHGSQVAGGGSGGEGGGGGGAGRQGKNKFKLEQLVVCRFERLGAKMQHIFRTASIIGVSFSARVLYGILPRQLKGDMTECVLSLLAQKWLFQDPEDDYLYHFAHSYLHGVIYELTPTRERNAVHQVIAEYIEETSANDPSQYVLIAHHFQYCHTDKSLRYAVAAVEYLLRNEPFGVIEVEDILDLLCTALTCCKTIYDHTVLRVVVEGVVSAVREALAAEEAQAALENASAKQRQQKVGSRLLRWLRLALSWHCISNNAVHPDVFSQQPTTASRRISLCNNSGRDNNSITSPHLVDTSPHGSSRGGGSGSSGSSGDAARQQSPMALLLEDVLAIERKIVKKTDVLLYIARGSLHSRTGAEADRGGEGDAEEGGAAMQCEPQPWQAQYLATAQPKSSMLSKLLNVDLFTHTA